MDTAAYPDTMPTPRIRIRRLTRADWLAAGLRVLSHEGADGLKAEPLARHLRTTKGSFYWHFKDVPAFHDALLALWEDAAMTALERTSDAGDTTPASRLRALAQAIAAAAPGNDALAAEPAIRGWARGNRAAHAAVLRVDAARLARLRALLSETGIDNPEIARIIQAAATGMRETGMREAGPPDDGDTRAAMGTLIDLVLALR